MLLTPAPIKPKSFESRRNSFIYIFYTRGGCVSCLRACLGIRLHPQSYQYPNLSDGVDRVAGQLRRDKECPVSGVTSSSRVWRKMPKAMLGVCPKPHFLCLPGIASTISAKHCSQRSKMPLICTSFKMPNTHRSCSGPFFDQHTHGAIRIHPYTV